MTFHIKTFLQKKLLIVVVNDKYFNHPLGFTCFVNNGHYMHCTYRIGNNIPSYLKL
jgi:hypothetical protein